ncbi:hypothetical protein [Streptomyces azureus]|uniref:hypothetical protein n=1 Tax=Streptomyces azureus TaxID=146537 RepID=UPI0007508109|nr:hypothetical protein [Streptomyces azureus]
MRSEAARSADCSAFLEVQYAARVTRPVAIRSRGGDWSGRAVKPVCSPPPEGRTSCLPESSIGMATATATTAAAAAEASRRVR